MFAQGINFRSTGGCLLLVDPPVGFFVTHVLPGYLFFLYVVFFQVQGGTPLPSLGSCHTPHIHTLQTPRNPPYYLLHILNSHPHLVPTRITTDQSTNLKIYSCRNYESKIIRRFEFISPLPVSFQMIVFKYVTHTIEPQRIMESFIGKNISENFYC